MANISYVDWDGLVYYDSKIKAYISNINKELLHIGGVVSSEQLPDPQRDNVNFIYQVQTNIQAELDRFTVSELIQRGSWVICIEAEPDVFKYAILSKTTSIDITQYYTKTEVDSKIEGSLSQINSNLTDNYVSKSMLFEEEWIFVCGNAGTEDTNKLIDFIQTNKLPILIDNGEGYSTTWVEYNTLDIPLTESAFYNADNRVGYQGHFVGNDDFVAQSFALPQGCHIVAVYKFDEGGTNEWLPQEVVPSFEWAYTGITKVTIDNQEYEYDVYSYDVGNMSSAIVANETWRFEFGG